MTGLKMMASSFTVNRRKFPLLRYWMLDTSPSCNRGATGGDGEVKPGEIQEVESILAISGREVNLLQEISRVCG